MDQIGTSLVTGPENVGEEADREKNGIVGLKNDEVGPGSQDDDLWNGCRVPLHEDEAAPLLVEADLLIVSEQDSNGMGWMAKCVKYWIVPWAS